MRRLLLLFLCIILGYSSVDGIEYKVNECLLADITATLKIPTSGGKFQTVKNVPSDGGSSEKGDCKPGFNRSSLLIPFENNVTLTINFDRRNEDVFMSTLTVEYDLANPDVNVLLTTDIQQHISSDKEYYVCNKPQAYTIKDKEDSREAIVTFESVKIQAFGVKNGTYSKDVSVCIVNSTLTSTSGPTPTPTPYKTSTLPTVMPTTQAPSTRKPTSGPISSTPHGVTTPQIQTTKAGPTSHPQTTMKPKANEVTGNVTDPKSKVVCVLVKFTGALEIPYTEKGTNRTYEYSIEAVKSTNGSCGNETQTIRFTLENGWILSMTFTKTGEKLSRRLLASDNSYYMNEIQLRYNTKDIPGAEGGWKVDKSDSKDRNKAEVGQSYQCIAEEDVKMEKGVNFTTRKLEIEAFRTDKTGKFSETVTHCEGDVSPGSNIVPIVVGVVLALLVVIIIIAYLIGRRRTQSGYQSV